MPTSKRDKLELALKIANGIYQKNILGYAELYPNFVPLPDSTEAELALQFRAYLCGWIADVIFDGRCYHRW